MKERLLQLNKFATKESTVESYVSFRKFVEFLKERIATEKGTRVQFYQHVLNEFEACPVLQEDISVDEAIKYKSLLETALSVVLPFIQDENKALVGFGNALSTDVFFSTDAFFKFLGPICNCGNDSCIGGQELSSQVHKEMQYNFILKDVYSIDSPRQKEWIHGFTNPKTGLYKYYRLNIDSRFVELKRKVKLPELDESEIKSQLLSGRGLNQLDKILPLHLFSASGFTIITLTDVTEQQAVEQIGKIVLDLNERNTPSAYREINTLLQTLIGSKDYRFGMMPFFTVNERAAILYENYPYSIIMKACWNAGISKDDVSVVVNRFLLNPGLRIFDASAKANEFAELMQQALIHEGISFYALIPVYYNSKLVGVAETAATGSAPANGVFPLNQIKPALPYISQLLRLYIDRFNIAIDTIVKDKFTNIQPAVQWKFNEVAWHYFRSTKIEHKNKGLEKVIFNAVFPLYGAVDIRNSTIERNKALRQDLQEQVELLIEIFLMLLNGAVGVEAEGFLKRCNYWSHHLIHQITIDELQIENFFKKDVHPALRSLNNLPTHISDKIAYYWSVLDEQTEFVCNKRDKLEKAFRLINNQLDDYFDTFKNDLIAWHPCYFEKFRTDGVEYDIYIGQSIAPKVSFSPEHLHKLRMWQVQSTATITKLTASLLTQMEYILETTQLIYVNMHAIDISFRNDERRFDVEGSYSIRYHVVKKRIDKVHILNTAERLTQPGKIAIVYFNNTDAEEYAGYIRQLQEQNVLLNDLEYLELEDLQGVTGLKALRVGVLL